MANHDPWVCSSCGYEFSLNEKVPHVCHKIETIAAKTIYTRDQYCDLVKKTGKD